MKENFEIIKSFINKKIIYIPMIITALCSYGFYITHPSIGVDDPSIIRYYVDGYAPVVGRYTLYLLNHIIRLTDFSPFILEFINVLLLLLSAIIWMTLIKKIVAEEIPDVLYTVFGCLFISFPLFNEIFVYYIHGSPGIGLGYALTAFASLSIYTYLDEKKWKKLGNLVTAIICFYFALGLYESFTIVYIMACAAVFFLYTLFKEEHFTWKKFFLWITVFIIPIIISIIFRSFTCFIVSFGTEFPNRMREVSTFKWMFLEGRKEQYEILKNEFIGLYGVNAFFYLPIRNYFISMIGFLVYSVIKIIRKKNGWIAIGAIGILLSPCLIMPIEGVVTPYRANLGLAFACALSIMLIANEIYRHFKYKWIVIFIAALIIYNQAFDLNHWFYLEDMKYQYQVELTNQLYYKLASKYDMDKKILFIGEMSIPETMKKHTHISYDSKEYRIITKLEETLKIEHPTRFFDAYGYKYTEVPDLFMYQWGQQAFGEGSVELAKFYAMHGYKMTPGTLGNWQEAQFLCQDAPIYPKEGSIIEFNNYIVVKLAEYIY